MALLTLNVDGELNQVAPIAVAVRGACAPFLDEEGLDAVELAVVEAATNVIRHGYGGRPGGRLSVSVEQVPDGVGVDLVDHAEPMPPRLLEAAEMPLPGDPDHVAGLAESGWGLALIRLSMDEVSYRPGPDGNWLRMIKRRA